VAPRAPTNLPSVRQGFPRWDGPCTDRPDEKRARFCEGPITRRSFRKESRVCGTWSRYGRAWSYQAPELGDYAFLGRFGPAEGAPPPDLILSGSGPSWTGSADLRIDRTQQERLKPGRALSSGVIAAWAGPGGRPLRPPDRGAGGQKAEGKQMPRSYSTNCFPPGRPSPVPRDDYRRFHDLSSPCDVIGLSTDGIRGLPEDRSRAVGSF